MIATAADRLLASLSLTLVTAVVCCSSGCGGGHYESQFESTLIDLRNKTGFNDISDLRVADLPNTGMTIRLPKLHVEEGAGAFDAQSPDPRNTEKPLSPERLQPLGLELPGYLRTYETFVHVGGVAEPLGVYCILAAVPVKQTTGEALRQQILAKFAPQQDEREHRNAPVAWQEVQVRTPHGTPETWWQLTVKMRDQRFHFYEWEEGPELGTVKSLTWPAYYDIFLHEGEQENLIVAWRTTRKAAEELGLPEIFLAAVGTVEFQKPAEPPSS